MKGVIMSAIRSISSYPVGQIHGNATEDIGTGDRICPDALQPSEWPEAGLQF